MSDILAKNPNLENVLRKAVDRIGQNHAKARDNEGAVISNEGTVHKYDSTKGVHPSRIGQTPTKGTETYKVLGEEKDEEVEEMEKEEEMDEATGASSAGAYSQPLFGDFKEEDVDKVMESVIKENVSNILLEEKLDKMVEDELDELYLGLNYDEIEPAYDFKSQGPFQGRMEGPGYNFVSQGPMNEDIKNKIVKKITEDYLSGKLKYEKPNTKGGFKDSTPGIEVTSKS
jgi:hypothetical protein